MKAVEHMEKPRDLCFDGDEFNPEVLQWIAKENLWNLWVPKDFGGLEMSLTNGLEMLRTLAQWDGSLGWTVTLCSGANFFVGNLQKDVAGDIFLNGQQPVFGGSGGVFGTAEKQGRGFVISGKWKYATGAPYLTHFTLNAKITEGGKEVLTAEGTPLVRSFILDRKDVEIFKDWDTMGLRATATHSFEVRSKYVDSGSSFIYNELHQPQPIFKVPFSIFADLTLWVNYIGMAQHFLEEAQGILGPHVALYQLLAMITRAEYSVMELARNIESMITQGMQFPDQALDEVHVEASDSVRAISGAIIGAYPLLGIRAASREHPLNQVFRDYFTATQHHIFSALGSRD